MKVLSRGLATMAIGCIAALGLTACDEVVVVGADGQGTCGGNSVTLTASQDGPGEVLTINYTGPTTSDVSLFFAQGFYVESDPTDPSSTSPVAFALGGSEPDEAYGLKLDVTDPGWSTSGSGTSTSYSFTGSVEDLINGSQTFINIADPGDEGEAVLNAMMPAFIGVDCDETATTGVITNSWAAAQPVYPNNMLINALDIVSSTPITDGESVTFTYPAEALTAFGTFTPSAPWYVDIFGDNPDVSNDSVANMWFQVFTAGGGPDAGAPVDNADGTFTIDITDSPLVEGDYLMFMIIPDVGLLETTGPSAAKVVFVGLRFSQESGFTLYPLEFLPPLESSEPTLPNTGFESPALLSALVAGFVMILAGVCVLASRRRAKSV